MRLIRASGLAALALLLAVIAAVRHDAESEASDLPEPQTSANIASPDDGRSASDGETVSFRQAVRELSFGQSDHDGSGYLFLTLFPDDLPAQPFTVVRHLDGEFSIGIALEASREEVDRLLAQVRVEGAAGIAVTGLDTSPTRPVLRLTMLEPEIVVTLGDLPPITIVKKDPLGVTPEIETPYPPTLGLFVQPSGLGRTQTVAIVPAGTPHLVLRFSEEMDRSPNPELPAGEWIDAHRYRIPLPESVRTAPPERIWTGGSLHGFRSAAGNYVDKFRTGYTVIHVLYSDWLDPATGARVGWSENDPFYENIVFSPDGEAYVGTAVVGQPEGDGTGSYHLLMLERKGEPAVMIEPYFYTGMLHRGSPVQWAGDGRVAYADFQSLYLYDVKDGSRSTLFSVAGTKWHILHAAWDPWAKQWNVMTGSFDAPDGSDYGPYPVELHLLDEAGNPIAHDPGWSLSPRTEYELMDHPVIPAENGVYRTFYRDGRPFTRFAGRDGSEAELPGAIQYADEGRAFLLEYVEGRPILYAWNPELRQLAVNGDAPNFIRAFGPTPVSESSGYYYRYDAESDEWTRWESVQALSLPLNGSSGMYKKH